MSDPITPDALATLQASVERGRTNHYAEVYVDTEVLAALLTERDAAEAEVERLQKAVELTTPSGEARAASRSASWPRTRRDASDGE